MKCSILGCARLAMGAAGHCYAQFHCRYHVQFKARHGSHWHNTYKAADLKPYLASAAEWINQQRGEVSARYALQGLQGLLDSAGRTEPAQDMMQRSGADKARVAFAR